MTVPIIIQARYSSTRLPGKVLLPWGDTTLLGHIIDECKKTGLPVWVATSTKREDAEVAAEAEKHGARAYRGSLDDVLGRFVGCVAAMDETPEAVVRICADRPFISAPLITATVREWERLGRERYLRCGEGSLTVEIISVTLLRRIDGDPNLDAYDREHVTSAITTGRRYETTVDSRFDYQALAPA